MNALILGPTVTLVFLLVLLLLGAREARSALVRNERVKLTATALSNLGVAAIIYGMIQPALNGSVVTTAAGHLSSS